MTQGYSLEDKRSAKASRERIEKSRVFQAQGEKIKVEDIIVGKDANKAAEMKDVKEQKAPVTPKVKKVPEPQSQDHPPECLAGYHPVWHDAYSYKNTAGTEITIRGHWEKVKNVEVKPKAKPEVKSEAKPEVKSEAKPVIKK